MTAATAPDAGGRMGTYRLLRELGVPSRASTMSFSVSDRLTGLEYNGRSPNALFAQRRNLLRPSYHRMVADLLRGDEAVNIYNVPPTDRIYPAPGDVERPQPVKVRTVDNVTIQHYFLLMIDGAYLYQVNIFNPDGTLADENLLYFVYPDGKVFWFYLER